MVPRSSRPKRRNARRLRLRSLETGAPGIRSGVRSAEVPSVQRKLAQSQVEGADRAGQ